MKFLQWLFKLFSPKKEPMPEFVVPVENLLTNTDKLLIEVQNSLGSDPTPKDETPDEVACAHSLSTIIQKVFPDFPILASTYDLDRKLFLDNRFIRVLEPNIGCIIVSPRNTHTFGHCGVFTGKFTIASNNSYTGKFEENYTWNSWIKEFKDKRGLRIYCYQIKS